MLTQEEIPYFKFIEKRVSDLFIKCPICKEMVGSFDMMEAQDTDMNIKLVCNSCIIDKGDFCSICGSSYILTKEELNDRNYGMNPDMCYRCRRKAEWTKDSTEKKSKKNLIKLSSIPKNSQQ